MFSVSVSKFFISVLIVLFLLFSGCVDVGNTVQDDTNSDVSFSDGFLVVGSDEFNLSQIESNLLSENIVGGKSIFGINGSFVCVDEDCPVVECPVCVDCNSVVLDFIDSETNLLARNIRYGISIFGVRGNYSCGGCSCPTCASCPVLDGNALDGNVLEGYSFYSNDSATKLVGTIPTITPNNSSTLFSSGFYDSDFNLSVIDSNLIAENILDTATIFGITGTASAGGGDPGFGFINFATPSYSDNGDETITDSANGLIWQKSSYGPGIIQTWQQTMDYCDGLSLAGSDEWRVPNVAEILLLYDYDEWDFFALFDNVASGGGSIGAIWSSTTVPSDTSRAFSLDSSGYIYNDNKIGEYHARCVRFE